MLFVLVMLFVLTFPLVNTLLTRARIDRDGEDVTATVVRSTTDNGRHLLAFRFPEAIDPEQETYSAQVDVTTFRRAEETQRVVVRVLEGEPRRHHVEGEVYSRSPWVFTIVGDLVVLVVGLWWVKVGRRRPSLRMRAMRDLEAAGAEEPTGLTTDNGEVYVAVGAVTAVEGSTVTLALDDRSVVVRLNGHDNQVAVGSRARAWGALVG
jgi:hypothetical protein